MKVASSAIMLHSRTYRNLPDSTLPVRRAKSDAHREPEAER